jgi:uncharacterized damage-inducible protein DinB
METGKLSREEIIKVLEQNMHELENLVAILDDSMLNKTRKNGKWTVKQIIGHLYDTEEVWGKRIELCYLKNKPVLESYDPELYVEKRNYKEQDIKNIILKYRHSRNKTLSLLNKDIWDREGIHQEEGLMNVQMLAETIALHEIHHLSQIKEIINTK